MGESYVMMPLYTVSLFGHRHIENTVEAQFKLEKTISAILSKYEYTDFLVGRNGDFDILAASVIKRTKGALDAANASLILVLPYVTAEYRHNQDLLLAYYNDVEIFHRAGHYKSAIVRRNHDMIDRSDAVIGCVSHPCGGAYQAIQYAKKRGKTVINLSE